MTESELHAEVKRLLDKHAVFYHHCTHPELCEGDAGWPDLFMAGPAGSAFAEEKSQTGVASPAQRAWSAVLNRAPLQVTPWSPWRLWRPEHLKSGQIESLILDLTRKPT